MIETKIHPLRWLRRRLRARRQDRRWRDKHARIFGLSDILVVSHTKSGRTWLRVLISHLMHLRYGAPADELIRFDNFQALHPAIPTMHFARDTRPPAGRDARHVTIADRQKVIFLVRDPRDTAVSFYFHVKHRATERELIRKGIPESARRLAIFDFVADPRYGVPRVVRFLNRWRDEARELRQARFVRYEDLRRDPEAELRRIGDFLGLDVTAAQIAEAVRFASFANLRQKEQEGFFRSDRLGATNSADPNTFKVRRGEIGGYGEHFTADQTKALDAMVEAALHPDYGYVAGKASLTSLPAA